MKFIQENKIYIIRLEKGERISEKLLEFCKNQNINSGFVSAIGAFLTAQIGFYNLEKKEYIFKELNKPHEIVSLTGNITFSQNEPFLHMHCVLSNENFECFGGHLKEGVVGATCEIKLKVLDVKIKRIKDEGIGLNLMEFEKKLI